jgi:hypothetical protein
MSLYVNIARNVNALNVSALKETHHKVYPKVFFQFAEILGRSLWRHVNLSKSQLSKMPTPTARPPTFKKKMPHFSLLFSFADFCHFVFVIFAILAVEDM